MICDLKTGICGESTENEMESVDLNQQQKKATIYYVTDPICSHCWALEPVLSRFEAEYGHYANFHTVMGGLLKSWDGFADVKNGIGSPSDVASHWKEVGEHSRMPIDGSLWLDNPIQSSYPPSRVFKVIQQQNEQLAQTFLRKSREAVFAFNRNIGEDQVLIDIVNGIGLGGGEIFIEANSATGQKLLDEDFALAASLGVRGFPTIIIVNEENKGVKIVGARSLDHYKKGLEQALKKEELDPKPLPSLKNMLESRKVLFSKEIEVMYDVDQESVKSFMEKEIPSNTYQLEELFGEFYIKRA